MSFSSVILQCAGMGAKCGEPGQRLETAFIGVLVLHVFAFSEINWLGRRVQILVLISKVGRHLQEGGERWKEEEEGCGEMGKKAIGEKGAHFKGLA